MVLKNFGALVQLVRIRACHARGQGFESPTHRQKRITFELSVFFVFVLLVVCLYVLTTA